MLNNILEIRLIYLKLNRGSLLHQQMILFYNRQRSNNKECKNSVTLYGN